MTERSNEITKEVTPARSSQPLLYSSWTKAPVLKMSWMASSSCSCMSSVHIKWAKQIGGGVVDDTRWYKCNIILRGWILLLGQLIQFIKQGASPPPEHECASKVFMGISYDDAQALSVTLAHESDDWWGGDEWTFERGEQRSGHTRSWWILAAWCSMVTMISLAALYSLYLHHQRGDVLAIDSCAVRFLNAWQILNFWIYNFVVVEIDNFSLFFRPNFGPGNCGTPYPHKISDEQHLHSTIQYYTSMCLLCSGTPIDTIFPCTHWFGSSSYVLDVVGIFQKKKRRQKEAGKIRDQKKNMERSKNNDTLRPSLLSSSAVSCPARIIVLVRLVRMVVRWLVDILFASKKR